MKRSHRRVPLALVMGGTLLLTLGLGEAIARFGLGLGTPPLSVEDPEIEYLFKPHQDLRRFHHRYAINGYGMRSEEMAPQPPQGVRRILVFGDSVLNGGAQIPQEKIATEVLLLRLSAAGQKVEVGNVSAGSWGPGNWRAWARRYGFLGASDVIVVLSSHDSADNPTFAPLDPQTNPTRNPPLALQELLGRYGWPRLQALIHRFQPVPVSAETEPMPMPAVDPAAQSRGLADLEALLVAARASGARVVLVQHWERSELAAGRADAGHEAIASLADRLGVPVVDAGPLFHACSADFAHLYMDNIHLHTQAGQDCLSGVLERALKP